MSISAPSQDADAAEDNADEPELPETEEPAVLQLSGTPLTSEELAAVAAVGGKLANAEPTQPPEAGSTGPYDRTLLRRRRLGLWGRPGQDSWQHAAGQR